MGYIERATFAENKKKLNIIIISVIATVCVLALVLGIYNLFIREFLYGILYLMAIIPGTAYVVIKINAIMPVYIAADEERLYMQCWENHAFPYILSKKLGFLTDFFPEKVSLEEILISNIKNVFVGSRAYLVRILENSKFEEETDRLMSFRKTEKNAIRKMDFICVEGKDKILYMPIDDVDIDDLARVINYVHKTNREATIKCNLKALREKLTYDKN